MYVAGFYVEVAGYGPRSDIWNMPWYVYLQHSHDSWTATGYKNLWDLVTTFITLLSLKSWNFKIIFHSDKPKDLTWLNNNNVKLYTNVAGVLCIWLGAIWICLDISLGLCCVNFESIFNNFYYWLIFSYDIIMVNRHFDIRLSRYKCALKVTVKQIVEIHTYA